jgi:hypothetical protein
MPSQCSSTTSSQLLRCRTPTTSMTRKVRCCGTPTNAGRLGRRGVRCLRTMWLPDRVRLLMPGAPGEPLISITQATMSTRGGDLLPDGGVEHGNADRAGRPHLAADGRATQPDARQRPDRLRRAARRRCTRRARHGAHGPQVPGPVPGGRRSATVSGCGRTTSTSPSTTTCAGWSSTTGIETVRAYVSAQLSVPFDRSRPLWEIQILTGPEVTGGWLRLQPVPPRDRRRHQVGADAPRPLRPGRGRHTGAGRPQRRGEHQHPLERVLHVVEHSVTDTLDYVGHAGRRRRRPCAP